MSAEDHPRTGIDSRVTALESDMTNVVRAVDRMSDILDRLSSRMAVGTNWGVLGTFAGVIISVVAGVGYLSLRPLRGDLDNLRAVQLRYQTEHTELVRVGADQLARIRALERKAFNLSRPK